MTGSITEARRGAHASVAFVLLISGCAVLSKPESTHFDSVRGGFKFRAIADAAYPEASPGGEAWRMTWLARNLKDNRVCPNGYVITSRKPVLLSTGTLGSIYDVYYEGRCTDLPAVGAE